MVSSADSAINDYAIRFGYADISVPAGETVTGSVGFADHDYQGDPQYIEWLNQVIDSGLQKLNIGFTIKNANGDVIVSIPTVEIALE